MDQEKRSRRMTVAGLLAAGLFIIGLAVVTSKPFQEHMAQTEGTQEMVSESVQEEPSESADEAPSKVADKANDRGR